jgi:hypothetical protein
MHGPLITALERKEFQQEEVSEAMHNLEFRSSEEEEKGRL